MTNFLNIVATSDAFKVERYLQSVSAAAPAHARFAVGNAGVRLLAKIRENASNTSPSSVGEGPGVITGVYRDSYGMTIFPELNGGATVVVGTDAPQAMRLEFGFVGTDSLGRMIHQGPRPHVGPAVDEIVPEFARELFDLALIA